MSTTPVKKRFRLSPPVMLGLGLVLIVAIVAFVVTRPKDKTEPYKAQAVTVGAITRSVSASGTLQPLVTVDVGSQISGQVKEVLVDFDSKVTEGQVLARIDPQTYVSKLQSNDADVMSANQGVNSSQASLQQAQANLAVAQADYNRTKILFDQGILAAQALEKADAELKSSRAQVNVAQAGVGSAQARLKQSQATRAQTQIDLGRTVITSPITGIVVDRTVDKGSTVAASLNAPVLFKIAQDLSKLQLQILVDEADVGQVREGQTVNFTVDAFPEDHFEGRLTQVRKSPQTQSNVVAYVVIAEADNPNGKLLPGMTTNADIVLEKHTNVLRVPNGALRWVPADQQTPTPARGGGFPGAGGGGFPGGGGGGGFPGAGARAGAGGAPGGGAGGGAARTGRRGGGNPLFVYDQLDLNPDQQAKIEKIIDESRKAQRERMVKMQKDMARGVQPDTTALRAEAQKRTEEQRAQIDLILTPAQKARAEQIRSAPGPQPARGQVYVLRNGKPMRIGVGIGVTDGSQTQVFTTRFVRGDEVIISGGPQPKAAAPTGAQALGGGMGGAPGGPRGPGR
jgi:HlyD family secretion protein